MKIALIVIGNGRIDYLVRTIESFNLNVVGQEMIVYRGMVNDSGQPDYDKTLKDMFGAQFAIINHETPRGAVEAIRTGRSMVPSDVDYFFWLEEDFVFVGPVNLYDMIEIMGNNPNVAQVALKRNPVSREERMLGDFMLKLPDSYFPMVTGDIHWLRHQISFTNNPCLIPWWILDYPVTDPPNSEGHYSISLREMQYWFGYLGRLEDAPLVTHIGEIRLGGGF